MKKHFLTLLIFSGFLFLKCNASEVAYSSQVGKSTKADYQLVIDYAKLYRTDTSLPSEEEESRKKIILQMANAYLVTYSSDNLENGVRRFLSDSLSLDDSEFTLIDVKTTELFGKSEAEVFLVKDRSDELRYIVKAFNDPQLLSSRFLQEISSIDLIKELNLSGISPIEQLAFALCTENENEWGLLLETAAKGKRLDEYISDIGKTEIGLENRKKSLNLAKTAMTHLGVSLARLHQSHPSTPELIPNTYSEKMNLKLNQVLNTPFIINELSKFFVIADFINYIEEVKSNALSSKLKYSFVHGDAHLGNVFFDPESNNCSFIDLCGLYQSIDILGQPLLHGVIDCVRIEDSLRFKSVGILTTEEKNELFDAFYAGYIKAGGQTPDPAMHTYYDTYIKLRRLISKSTFSTKADPRIQMSDQAIFEDAINYFYKHILKLH